MEANETIDEKRRPVRLTIHLRMLMISSYEISKKFRPLQWVEN